MVTGMQVKLEDIKKEEEVEDFVTSMIHVIIMEDGPELKQMVGLHNVIETHV